VIRTLCSYIVTLSDRLWLLTFEPTDMPGLGAFDGGWQRERAGLVGMQS
jgi:hypothetical protein